MRAETLPLALMFLEVVVLIAATACSCGVFYRRWPLAVPGGCEITALFALVLLTLSMLLDRSYCLIDCLVGVHHSDVELMTPKNIPARLAQIIALTILTRPTLERLFGKDWVMFSTLIGMLIVSSAAATIIAFQAPVA